MPVIDRQRPGKGYRHVLMQRDIETFIGLLPDWAELSRGLNAIVLAPGEYRSNGWHTPGVVGVCAWEADLWVDYAVGHYEDHKPIFDRLGVASHSIENGVMCEFTEAQARAYQLLHILLHELGHHHDRMTTKSQGPGQPGRAVCRGVCAATRGDDLGKIPGGVRGIRRRRCRQKRRRMRCQPDTRRRIAGHIAKLGSADDKTATGRRAAFDPLRRAGRAAAPAAGLR